LPSLLALVDAELQRKDETMSDTAPAGSAGPAADAQPDAAATPPQPVDAVPAARPSAPASGGGFGRLVSTALVAAIVSGAVTVTAPQWQPLLGLGGTGAQQADTRLAGLQQDVAQLTAMHGSLAAKADIAAALTPLQDDIAQLKTQLGQITSAGGATGAGAATAPATDLGPLNDKIAGLEATLAALQAKVTAAPNTTNGAAAPAATLPDLSPEVAALKIQNESLRDQIAALGGKIDSLSKDDLGKVGETLGSVSQRIATLEAQVAAAPAPVTARQQLATATVLSIGQLQSLLASAQSFAGELTALKQLAASDVKLGGDLNPVIDKLAPIASTGAPTLSQLQASLPVTEIARGAEAEQASAIAADAGWWRRMTHRLAEIVTVRPVGDDVSGDGPLERLARAEGALKRGDLAKTVDEISGMTGEPAKRAATWLAQAQARLTLDGASARLAEIAARQLVPATSNSN
jgi:hypothetical protein